jgi:hypothetical protein
MCALSWPHYVFSTAGLSEACNSFSHNNWGFDHWKRISIPALLGYLAGAGAHCLQVRLLYCLLIKEINL